MATDKRHQPFILVPVSGWAATGLDIPAPPDVGEPLSETAMAYWANAFSGPASINYGPSELMTLRRLAELYGRYSESFKPDAGGNTVLGNAPRYSAEIRAIEAALQMTAKSRRDMRMTVVSDAEWRDSIDKGTETHFASIPIDVLTGLSRDEVVSGASSVKGDGEAEAKVAALVARFGPK